MPDWAKLLTATPVEIQAALDEALKNAPAPVKAVIQAVDYVAPGEVRRPEFKHYLKFGEYEDGRELVEIAVQVKPGLPELAVATILKML